MQHRLCAAPPVSPFHCFMQSSPQRLHGQLGAAAMHCVSPARHVASSPPHRRLIPNHNKIHRLMPMHCYSRHRYLKATTQKPLPNSRCPQPRLPQPWPAPWRAPPPRRHIAAKLVPSTACRPPFQYVTNSASAVPVPQQNAANSANASAIATM